MKKSLIFGIFLLISASFFGAESTLAEEEGKPILCQEKLADQCSVECLQEFVDYNEEYRKCLNDCIDKKIDECPPIPPYELDFAPEPSLSQVNNLPTVEILSPKDGDSFEKIVPIKWKSSDPEGKELSHTIQLRLKEGHSWLTLENNYLENSFDHYVPPPYAIISGQIRITVTDGVNESSAISGVFSANLETGTDLTQLHVRWDPFDKRWQPYVVETNGIVFFALLYYGMVIAIALAFGFGIYFGTKYLMKRKLKQPKLEKKYKFAALGIAFVVFISFLLWVFR